ncbi:phosphoglycerate kinase [Encephalitozoon intestinalis ATCC 50506]|uniref:Phosphoglycerate kinase n=1 Tax=Encephalitozoon intestinalis (strain ATCC 50506) TaxID=876142 RepID=E0S751_ENCIT|nr:phosphoglycerate kinase [Encephalitozoon intestinalis ATCC 50506]ADM11479.1 phosphoglycerate kinase [Encephalitozoon intestinalis ATCC 50506]UTX45191.1 phosphoglycerate kinase [Encephalitozoon intestinalis]
MKTINDVDIEGKSVFLRADLNVPLSNSTVLNNFKIVSVLPTIRLLYSKNPKRVIIGSHFGRPRGKYSRDLSLQPVYRALKELLSKELGIDLIFCDLWDVGSIEDAWVLVENLRFYYGEEESDDQNTVRCYRNVFVNNMDIAVIDAFGCLHRKCGSIQRTGLPSYSGLLVQKELVSAREIMRENIDLMILGGKKASDKIKLLKSLGERTRSLFITGGLAFPFIKYIFGREVGKSICSDVSEEEVKSIYEICRKYGTNIVLPIDFVVLSGGKICITNGIPSEGNAMDIGPGTVELLRKEVSKARVVFWNGPPGVFEEKDFSEGTKALVSILESLKKEEKKSFCGGGETVGAIKLFGNYDNFTYVSTGGGALMKLLSGENLPGLDFLSNQP